MELGPLTSYQKMEKYYEQMRAVSRAELLTSIYKNDGRINEVKIQTQLSQAFTEIIHNYTFNTKSYVVTEILNLFDIKPSQLENKTAEEREQYLNEKILDSIEQKLKRPSSAEGDYIEYQLNQQNPQNQFDWIGVKSNFPNLRSIFQQILLEKVKQFDDELSRLTENYIFNEQAKQQIATTARTLHHRSKSSTTRTINLSTTSRLKPGSTFSVRNIHKDIEKKGFTNVLIRDHSEFTLKKWTKSQEKDFQKKKYDIRVNLRKNGKQNPVIFQFVKKYTNTVKARDNIYQKWENRQKNGITPEELKYLCSTSLFLNKTLNKSEKERLNRNIKSLGKELISKLEFNIAQKIIETYKQFMKKVADLRAHYYEELTKKRKIQQEEYKKKQEKTEIDMSNRRQFFKFRQIFQNICSSQKMKVILNPKVHRWVKQFISNLKKTYTEKTGKILFQYQEKEVFGRLTFNSYSSHQLMRAKVKHPSARVIKRQDIGTMRQPMKKYIPTERFHYEKSIENRIKILNSVKVKTERSFHKQISGGPGKVVINQVRVNLLKREIVLTSSQCLKSIIRIQAKWRGYMMRKRYLSMLEDHKMEEEKDFQQRLKSLRRLYPQGLKINLKSIENRLKRVSMRTLSVFKPYQRSYKKPINNYTSFSKLSFSLAELKIKQAKNSSRRLAQFGKMVELNQFGKLMKSGFVVTAKEINDPIFKDGASAMWWAVKNSNTELTRIFLEGGGNPNAHNNEGSTCLHEAMQNGALEIIFILLDYGADLNIKNNKKATPLYYATPKMLKWLGLQEGSISGQQMLKDNNKQYFKPQTQQNFYLDHYY